METDGIHLPTGEIISKVACIPLRPAVTMNVRSANLLKGKTMPTYEYECSVCGDQFSCDRKLVDPDLKRKPGCENKTCKPQKVISRIFGHVKSGAYQSRNEILQSESPPIDAETPVADPIHVCSKYCDHH